MHQNRIIIDKKFQIIGIITTSISTFITAFTGSASNIALPNIAADFNLNAVMLSWVTLSYMITTAALVLPMGRISDIYGRKKIFIAGTIIFTIGSLLSAFSINIATLIIFRIIQGSGAAMLFGTSIAILTNIFPQKKRGSALGINTASVYIGLSAGPVIGGLLTNTYGWQSIFFICIPFGILVVITALLFLKGEWNESSGESFDLIGTFFYALFLIALILGFSNITEKTGLILTALSVLFFSGMIIVESKVKHPVFNLDLFRGNKAFTFSNIAALINYSATFGVGFLMSLFLQSIKGFSPEKAGLILLTQPLIQALFSPLTGKLSDTIEPKILASTGMILTTIGLFLFSFLKLDTPVYFIIVSLITLGAGFALFSSPNTNAVMRSIGKKHFGVGSATLSTMRIIGQILSLGIATLMFALLLGKAKIVLENQMEFLKSINITFRIFTILCFAGIFFSLIRGKVHKNRQED